MYKDLSYKQKYEALVDWLPLIIESIKKDLKNEHLKKDLYFVKKYLGSKNLNKATAEDLTEAYRQAIASDENGEEIAEFITTRWLLKNTDVYDFFETQLSQLALDFTSLQELDQALSQKIMDTSIQQFGASSTYLFSVLNSVVFPADIFHRLKQYAEQEVQQNKQEEGLAAEKNSLDNLQRNHEQEMSRLIDKYEKKLEGLQKKYHTDVENLKKQVASLQRKIQGKSA